MRRGPLANQEMEIGGFSVQPNWHNPTRAQNRKRSKKRGGRGGGGGGGGGLGAAVDCTVVVEEVSVEEARRGETRLPQQPEERKQCQRTGLPPAVRVRAHE